MKIEDFIKVPGFEEYLINKNGEIYSTKVSRLLSTPYNTNGYKMIRFNKDGKQYSYLLHRVLAFVFGDLPSLNSELEVDHIDSDKNNYNLNNLQTLSKKHHQEKTYGYRYFAVSETCSKCSNKISTCNTSGLCRKCRDFERTNDGITLDNIIYWVTNFSWVRAGKELSLSDNGVRKRFTKLSKLKPNEIYSLRPSKRTELTVNQ